MIVSRETFPVVMEQVTDPEELAAAQAQDERFRRNWDWFKTHAPDIYRAHRGKVICVAGQELFVADTATEAVASAQAAHPDDNGRFTRIIPRERLERIYAHQR